MNSFTVISKADQESNAENLMGPPKMADNQRWARNANWVGHWFCTFSIDFTTNDYTANRQISVFEEGLTRTNPKYVTEAS